MNNLNKESHLHDLGNLPGRVVILGAGRDGTAMFETLMEEVMTEVVAVVDIDESAPGCILAKEQGIKVFVDIEEAIAASVPCVVFNMTGNEMVEEVVANTLGVGGVVGGLGASLMWRVVTDLKRAKKELEFQASHDVLTNLVNRRFMLEHMQQELERCKRYGVSCAVVMIDLDKFKSVNDEHGHTAGDVVLKTVTERIDAHLRGVDVLARWGGEEFLALLPHTQAKDAVIAVEKCLAAVIAEKIVLDSGITLQVSFSAGIVSFDELDKKGSVETLVDEMLVVADTRLYRAKELGRSQVVSVG